ncbi:MAG TPA: CDP-alcohol phosphatidyltransferase family protein, partial [Ignavibacteria bacterium]|nr:CDP-alcohol phosphatidyltransferase family protein [Ignavibacteria bacterium]
MKTLSNENNKSKISGLRLTEEKIQVSGLKSQVINLLNLPNTLSLLRIILAPVFLYLFISENETAAVLSFAVYTFAALTDWYDGWYARKYGYKTKWGQFIDPLADKILTSAAFIGFYLMKQKNPMFFGGSEIIPIWLLVSIIILRDITLTIARSLQELRGREFRTSMISKTKTFVQMTFIFLIIGMMAFGILLKG